MVLYAKDIVEKDFLSLPPETDALSAAKLMADRKHGFAVVVSKGQPEGVVTEWDYLKAIAMEKDLSSITLGAMMTGSPVSVSPNDGIDFVARLMAEKGIRRVLVIQDGKVLGVITAKTVLARMKEYLEKISSQIARMQVPIF